MSLLPMVLQRDRLRRLTSVCANSFSVVVIDIGAEAVLRQRGAEGLRSMRAKLNALPLPARSRSMIFC